MAVNKSTPKERAAARSKAKQGDQLKSTKANMARPGKVAESGTAGYAVVRLAQAGVKSAAKAVSQQNKAAKTYISKGPRTAAQKAADARTSARMKKVNKDARQAPYYKAAAGTATAGVVMQGGRKPQTTTNKSVQAAAKKKQADLKKKK